MLTPEGSKFDALGRRYTRRGPVRKNPRERFMAKVAMDEKGCWRWSAHVRRDGYGSFTSYDGVKVLAHRWAYENLVGEIPEGMQIDHVCRVRDCVNPQHLEVVTTRENTLRGIAPSARASRAWAAGRCCKGHDLSVVGWHEWGRKRACRKCRKDSYERRKKARACLPETK